MRDGEITGFALRVTSTGAKSSFVREGRNNGRTCRDTLGRFPDLSVVEARAKAFEYKPGSRAAKTRTSPATRWCARQTVDSHHGHYASNPLVALLRTMFTVKKLWGMLKEENPVRRIKLFHEEELRGLAVSCGEPRVFRSSPVLMFARIRVRAWPETRRCTPPS